MNANGIPENETASKKGANVAKIARLKLEEDSGKKVITNDNFLPKRKKLRY